MPEPEIIAEKGSIVLCAYPAGSFRSKEKVLRFCRWRAGGNRLYLSEFIPMEEFDCLLEILDDRHGVGAHAHHQPVPGPAVARADQ